MIVTPLCLYDNVYVERTEPNKTEVYFDGVKDASALSSAVGKIADVIGYGLLVKIKSNVDRRFNLITNENYLSAIISAVAALGRTRTIFIGYSIKPRKFTAATAPRCMIPKLGDYRFMRRRFLLRGISAAWFE